MLPGALFGAIALTAQVVAVLPFQDLSGRSLRGSIGEAIRETVTTDLRDVPGLRVVERTSIDAVITQQNLAATVRQLDGIHIARVGTLLGATLIVTGAYQRVGARIRLTARFVRVETGEIVGTAKVDGDGVDFLRLQDKITVELLRSAGFHGAPVDKFLARARPPLKTLRPLELYGDALIESDEGNRQRTLKEAVALDGAFEYAARDLAALERGRDAYASVWRGDPRPPALLEKIDDEKDPAKLRQHYVDLLEQLLAQRRHDRQLQLARWLLAHPPAAVPDRLAQVPEHAQRHVVLALSGLLDDEGVLREGEIFRRRYPASTFLVDVQRLMASATEHKRN